MSSDQFDVAVIGGGINGAGVAQQAAALGYKVLLLEKNPHPGLETSSRSSKLIHGGLRYLETMELSLVRESLKERELLLKLAADLVQLQTFNIPIYSDTSRTRIALHAGLSLYAMLAGLQRHHLYHRLKPRHWDRLDGLDTKNLRDVFQYQDAQTDDLALTESVLASAIDLGTEYQSSANMISANIDDQDIIIRYQQNGEIKTASSRSLVNASGPWVHTLNQCISPLPKMLPPDLIQGSHLVLNRPLKQAYYMESPQDKRAVFLLPWKGRALLGTTETILKGNPGDMHVTDRERQYLLTVYGHYFPTTKADILQEMSGCRVLAANDANLFSRSRDVVLEADNKTQPRLVSIIGGKLTVYRQTAIKVMSILKATLPHKRVIADTSTIKLHPVDIDVD